MKIYINGVQDTVTATAPAGGIYASNANLHIGAWQYGSAARSTYFNGTIDEVKIWNRALTEDEIKAEYDAGVPECFAIETNSYADYIFKYLNFI